MRTLSILLMFTVTAVAAEKPHLVIITAEDEYKTEVTLPKFAKAELDRDYKVTLITADPKKQTLPHLDQLKTADGLLLSIRRMPLKKADLEAVKAYVAAGKPVVALRTSSHAFALRKGEKLPEGVADWPTFDTEILGCKYTGHTKHALGTKLTLGADHAVLKDLPKDGFTSSAGLYTSSPLAKDCVVLLKGVSGDKDESVAWVREKADGHGRVAYIALAHETDFAGTAFPKLLANAIHWAVPPVK